MVRSRMRVYEANESASAKLALLERQAREAARYRQAEVGERVAPDGSTEGVATYEPCEVCGATGHWNPGAGRNLCRKHWDEY